MNRVSVSHYLRNPSKLVEISIGQIEKWIQESPYSQPLRTLLAKKRFLNQKVILESTVTSAATITSNRHWLYKELHTSFQQSEKPEIKSVPEHKLEVIKSATKKDIIAPITENEESLKLIKKDISEIVKEHDLNEEEFEPKIIEENVEEVELNDSESITDNEVKDEALIKEEEVEDEILEDNSYQELEVEYEEFFKTEEEEEEEEEEGSSAQNIDFVNNDESTDAEIQDISEETLKSSIATLDFEASEMKVVDINANTSEEAIISDEHKPVKSKKKKSKKDKVKSVKQKSKKSKKKEKRKVKSDSSSKKKKKSKNSKSHLLADSVSSKGIESKSPHKKKKGKSKKKKKIKLTKVDIPVNTNGEYANEFKEQLDEMSSYTKWLLTFGKDKDKSSLRHMKSLKKKKKTKNKKTSTPKIESVKKKKGKKKSKGNKGSKKDDSLKVKEEVISELWADLLAKQGHIKKARKMYLKLSLKYPEKSTYFASKLENIKSK